MLGDDDEGATRRSGRARHKPLEFWNGQHIIYGRQDRVYGSLLPTPVEVFTPVDPPVCCAYTFILTLLFRH
jgi:hypothetical protein